MAEQALDLRSTMSQLRRRRGLLSGATVIGGLAGAAVLLVWPPQYSSESVVLLPPTQTIGEGSAGHAALTEIRIASSEVVLAPAARAMEPPMSLRSVERSVQVTAPAEDIIEIRSFADSAEVAESLAQQVAVSEVNYLSSAAKQLTTQERDSVSERLEHLERTLATVSREIRRTRARQQIVEPRSAEGIADASAISQLTAQQADLVLQISTIEDARTIDLVGPDPTIIQNASPARRPGWIQRLFVATLTGALVFLILVGAAVGVVSSRDRRLRWRDEIADAVGTPVVASVSSQAQRTPSGWASLLEGYRPASRDIWALRRMLRHLAEPGDEDGDSGVVVGERRMLHPASLTVVSLSDDPVALAMGPQIASYAAAAGVETVLVAAQHHESAAPLWAACVQENRNREVRRGLKVETRVRRTNSEFTVTLVVVDRHEPELGPLQRTAATVLAVSSGAATAEELARVAVAADESGLQLAGVVVADPDAADRTTGRMLQRDRPQQAHLPSRLTGVERPTRGSGSPRSAK